MEAIATRSKDATSRSLRLLGTRGRYESTRSWSVQDHVHSVFGVHIEWIVALTLPKPSIHGHDQHEQRSQKHEQMHLVERFLPGALPHFVNQGYHQFLFQNLAQPKLNFWSTPGLQHAFQLPKCHLKVLETT